MRRSWPSYLYNGNTIPEKMVFILKRDPYFDNMLLNCWNSWSVWVYGSHEVLTFPSSELDMAGWSEMQILHSEVRWAGYGWHQASCTPKVNRVNSGVIPKAIQGPVLLLLRSDTVASLLANGSAAFIWKLHCHWLRDLPERHITVLTHWGHFPDAIFQTPFSNAFSWMKMY